MYIHSFVGDYCDYTLYFMCQQDSDVFYRHL